MKAGFVYIALIILLGLACPVSATWLNLTPHSFGSPYYSGTQANFSTIRNESGNNLNSSHIEWRLVAGTADLNFTRMDRGVIVFNTSDLEGIYNVSSIDSVEIWVKVTEYDLHLWPYAVGAFFEFTNGSVSDYDNIQASDYEGFEDDALTGYIQVDEDFPVNTRTYTSFLSDKRNYINESGYTVLFFREVNDVTNTFLGTWSSGNQTVAVIEDVSLNISYTSGSAPVADFAANRTGDIGETPQDVQFTDLSTNTPTTWSWVMTELNGTPIEFSTDQNPVESFYEGNWSIKLTASNTYGGNTSTNTTWINVSFVIPPTLTPVPTATSTTIPLPAITPTPTQPPRDGTFNSTVYLNPYMITNVRQYFASSTSTGEVFLIFSNSTGIYLSNIDNTTMLNWTNPRLVLADDVAADNLLIMLFYINAGNGATIDFINGSEGRTRWIYTAPYDYTDWTGVEGELIAAGTQFVIPNYPQYFSVAPNPEHQMIAAFNWWDYNWPYRVLIQVSNITAVEGMQAWFAIDPAFDWGFGDDNAAAVNWSKVRFTTVDVEPKELSYELWNPNAQVLGAPYRPAYGTPAQTEAAGAAADAGLPVYWVKLPAGTVYIYMYYGNENATAGANPESTFDIWDDFQFFNSSKWQIEENTTGEMNISSHNGGIQINCISTDKCYVYSEKGITPPVIMEGIVETNSLMTDDDSCSFPGTYELGGVTGWGFGKSTEELSYLLWTPRNLSGTTWWHIEARSNGITSNGTWGRDFCGEEGPHLQMYGAWTALPIYNWTHGDTEDHRSSLTEGYVPPGPLPFSLQAVSGSDEEYGSHHHRLTWYYLLVHKYIENGWGPTLLNLVWNGTHITGWQSVWPLLYEPYYETIVPTAAWSSTVYPPYMAVVGENVSFFDNSYAVGSYLWYWNFGDGQTATTQNPVHKYTAPGIYNISFCVSNAWGTGCANQTSYVTVVDIPTLVWTADPRFWNGSTPLNTTFTDSTSLQGEASWTDPLQIWFFGDTASTVTNSRTTTHQYAIDNNTYSPMHLIVPMNITAIIGELRDSYIQTVLSGQSLTYYAPVHIRFTVVSSNGIPLDNVTVRASFNQSTLADDSWIHTLYGVNPAMSPSLISSNATMSGVTDLTGSIVFTMFPSFQYDMHFSDTVRGIDHQIRLFPQLTEYTIWIPGVAYTQREAEALQTSLFVTEESPTEIALNLTYNDTARQTTNVTFFVMAPNQTFVYTESASGSSANFFCASYTTLNIRGDSYYWGYYSMGTVWPNSTPYAKGITFKGPSGVLVDLGLPDLNYYIWISFALIMLVGGIFTSERTAYFGVVLVPMLAGLFVWFGWIQSTFVAGSIALMIVLGVLVYIKSQYRRSFGIAGPGEMFISIVFYLIILQACVGLVNTVMPNPYGAFAPTQTNVTETIHYTMTDAQAVYDPSSTNTILKVADIVWTTVTLPFTILITFINIIWSIINLYGTLTHIFYFDATPATQTLAAILEGVWLILLVRFIWVIFWKPPPGEATL